MFVAGYGHFLRTAASLQWDEADVDLRPDARAWPELAPALRERVELLVAGFCIAEAAVAEDIVPFGLAAPDPDAAACFEAQAIDEQRHARFFDRVAAEVMTVPGGSAPARRSTLRPRLPSGFVDLFEERLPRVARALAAPAGGEPARARGALCDAVALYHLVLEGVVFSAGQLALLRLLDGPARVLAGLREGLERVLADERWHIGLGVRLLDDVGGTAGWDERLVAEAVDTAAIWGDAVETDLVERVIALHRRRLGVARLVGVAG